MIAVAVLAFVAAGSAAIPAAAPQQAPGAVASAVSARVAEPINAELNAKLRSEGMERSKVMWIAQYLTDVYGPRPVGSPNHVAAANWAIKTMTGWGLTNAHLEPFTWRGVGWLPGRATGYITSPVKANLKFEAIPWSPSTAGTVSGEVVHIIAPVNPTEAELTEFLTRLAPKVKGGIVMVGSPVNAPVSFNEQQKRTPDEQVRTRYAPAGDGPARGRPGGPGGNRGRGAPAPTPEGRLSAAQVTQRITALIRDNPPALRLAQSGAGRIPGVIVAQNGAGQTYEPSTQIGPGVILRNEDYGRIARIIADGTPVSVEFTVSNQYFPEGSTSYVTVAEIPGTDKADEVVMLGGHLDSWTSGTGATDNAIGCAIMMEAMRLLQTVAPPPRRTIRIALWSGEEQGLLGSVAYVRDHFGSSEAPKPGFSKLQAYWNIDEGTGRVRGATIFGPPDAGAILAQVFKPFEDWGIFGASATNSRSQADSDYGAFNEAGLPGINTQQDPIEYESTTWHTNLDTYERIVPDDVMKNSVVTASVMYHLATREALLPRFGEPNMPAMPAGRGGGAAGRGGAPASAAPTAPPHVYAASKNRALTVNAPGLLPPAAGPTIATAPPATAAIVTMPPHGRLALKADGSFVYTPARNFTGTDTFTYTLSTASGTSAPATVTVVVN
jgi:hypothetical protein